MMDCMDCHNRPSQSFFLPRRPWTAPWRAAPSRPPPVDQEAGRGCPDEGLPGREGPSTGDPGVIGILREEYPAAGTETPDLRRRRRRGDLRSDVFPSMNVNWKTYPSNIGHRNWPGCFRCHDGYHRNASGEALVRCCSACHTMPRRGPLLPLGGRHAHEQRTLAPWPLKGTHARILCNLCHRAGYRPPDRCISCHRLPESAPMMSGGCDICHVEEGEVKPLASCAPATTRSAVSISEHALGRRLHCLPLAPYMDSLQA